MTSRTFLYVVVAAELIGLFLLVRISPALAQSFKRFERREVRAMQIPKA